MGAVLYAIAEQVREITDRADDETGELSPADLERLDGLLPDLDAKVDAYCKLVRTWEALAAARKVEAQRLTAGAGVMERNARRLKDRLRQALETVGAPRHETALFKVWRHGSPPAVRCLLAPGDYDRVPDRFKRVEVVVESRKVLDEWRETGAVPAGFVVERGEHLRIS